MTKKILQHQRELKALQSDVLAGVQDLYYFDEVGFSLTPSVPYGWQPIGKRIEIPSSKSKQINVLGFLNYQSDSFHPYMVEGAVDASIVITCVNWFCSKLSRPTTVVIDNAPIHTSAEFQSKIPEWEDRGLYFWFLPAYSPELNLIERLWKQIKYSWLPLEAYQSFEKLNETLAATLAKIGKTLRLNFN